MRNTISIEALQVFSKESKAIYLDAPVAKWLYSQNWGIRVSHLGWSWTQLLMLRSALRCRHCYIAKFLESFAGSAQLRVFGSLIQVEIPLQ